MKKRFMPAFWLCTTMLAFLLGYAVGPVRSAAIQGAAAAAQMAGDSGKAKSYYSKLRDNCPPAADREELQKMKMSAAGSN